MIIDTEKSIDSIELYEKHLHFDLSSYDSIPEKYKDDISVLVSDISICLTEYSNRRVAKGAADLIIMLNQYIVLERFIYKNSDDYLTHIITGIFFRKRLNEITLGIIANASSAHDDLVELIEHLFSIRVNRLRKLCLISASY